MLPKAKRDFCMNLIDCALQLIRIRYNDYYLTMSTFSLTENIEIANFNIQVCIFPTVTYLLYQAIPYLLITVII